MKCDGYRKYSRNPDRIVWYECDDPATINGRCRACDRANREARDHEADDEIARLRVRQVLGTAIEPLRPLYAGKVDAYELAMLMSRIEAAVKETGELGGSGAYWTALWLFVGLEDIDSAPHKPLESVI